MEPRFINRYTMTKEMIREFQWKVGRFNVLAILCAVAVVTSTLSAIFNTGSGRFSLLIFTVFFTALLALMFFMSANGTWKRIVEQSGGAPREETVAFTEEQAYNDSAATGGRVNIDYASLKKVIVTKNLIVLKTKAKLGYILRRDSFVLGTEKEFMAFISAKIALNSLK